jgi:Gp37 protein
LTGREDETLMAATLDGSWSGEQFSPPTPLDLATVESAIVAALGRALGNQLAVEHFPDKPESYRLTHRVGAALVTYRGATYGEMRDIGAIIQERRLEFEITVMVRDLGWAVGGQPDGTSPGAYAILEAVRAALTGFQVPGARKMYPLSEKFLGRDREGGLWMYAIRFALVTVAVETSDAEDFPLFIKGIAQESGGQSTTTLGAAPYTFNAQDQIALANGNVLALSLTSLAGVPYAEGTDYALDPVNGIITRLASGAIASGATVNVAYSYGEVAIAGAGQSAPTAE